MVVLPNAYFETSQPSDEIEKQVINEIKNGTIRNSKGLDKFIEGIEDKLGRYNSDNKGTWNERNLTNENDSFRISEQANERRNNNEGSEFTWYTNGEDDRIDFSTSDAIIYGWQEDKSIYLTPEGINPNTPVHEYTHLWSKAVQKGNPALWERCKDMAKTTAVWEEVMNDSNYGFT